jgi:hypothetical protein
LVSVFSPARGISAALASLPDAAALLQCTLAQET